MFLALCQKLGKIFFLRCFCKVGKVKHGSVFWRDICEKIFCVFFGMQAWLMINWYAAIMSIVRLCNTHELKSIVHVLFQWDKVLPVGSVHLSQQSSHSNQCTTASAQGTRPPAVPRLQGKTGSLFDVIFVCVCVCGCMCVCVYNNLCTRHSPTCSSPLTR